MIICIYIHTYIRQSGEDEGFLLVPDDDAPPSLTSPATSDSSPPTPPIRPVPGAPEPDPLPDRLPGPPDPLPDRHAEPVTAPLWKKLARWVLRLAFKKRLWAHLGQHLKTLKALGLGAAPGASRRRGGTPSGRLRADLPPPTPEYSALRGQDAPGRVGRRYIEKEAPTKARPRPAARWTLGPRMP